MPPELQQHEQHEQHERAARASRGTLARHSMNSTARPRDVLCMLSVLCHMPGGDVLSGCFGFSEPNALHAVHFADSD